MWADRLRIGSNPQLKERETNSFSFKHLPCGKQYHQGLVFCSWSLCRCLTRGLCALFCTSATGFHFERGRLWEGKTGALRAWNHPTLPFPAGPYSTASVRPSKVPPHLPFFFRLDDSLKLQFYTCFFLRSIINHKASLYIKYFYNFYLNCYQYLLSLFPAFNLPWNSRYYGFPEQARS